MAINLENIENRLKEEIGSLGFDYLFPQLEIIRNARNLPSTVEDSRLMTQKFFHSYQMIQKWIAPVVVPITDELLGLESQLRILQEQMRFHIRNENIFYWKHITHNEDPAISSLYEDIINLQKYIIDKRLKLLSAAHRDALPELFGLVLWPFTEYHTLNESINEIKKLYFGKNFYYNKNNVFIDALILTGICEDIFVQRKKGKESIKQIEDLIETRLRFRRAEEQFEWSRYKRDQNDGMFTEMQVNTIIKELLPGLPISVKKEIYAFYDSAQDKYPISKFLEWLTYTLREKSAGETAGSDIETDSIYQKDFLIGLSFMDKHRRREILGNISDLGETLDRILAPFHELKQENAFMQSAQFEIESMVELPSQAWIYDYSGVETEILRSTLLLISDKQPKFDVLEACQRLSNIILSGRVDRNDFRRGNYVVTNSLPPKIWKNLGRNMLLILEEALIKEEIQAVQLIKNIFHDEDRSRLVTSKKFVPIFQVETNYREDYQTRSFHPNTMDIWAKEGFIFQYRFAQLSGYPWYFDVNALLEALVIEALQLPSHKMVQLHENVKLRQTVYSIDEETYIVYYEATPEKIKALAFKEVDILDEEGIDPVEVIFRPHKFLRLGPERNNLKLILENARATDPKDLMTVISTL